MHNESTQQSALPVKLPLAIPNFANYKQSNILPATTHSTSATMQPSTEPSNNHTIIPEHSNSTLLKEPGVKESSNHVKKFEEERSKNKFESSCSHFTFRSRARFEQGVP